MAAIEASLRLEIAQYQAALARARGEIDKLKNKAKKDGAGLSNDLFGGLQRGVMALGATLGAYKIGSAMLDGVMSMERMEKMLVTTTGSAAAAKERFEELREVAKLPGIGLEQAVQGDANLRAVGMSADMSKKAIVEFGNALALVGKGGADLDGVLLAITQISTKGKVFTEEINQIAERLPQTRAMLKEAFGTSSAEDIQKMGLSFEDFITRYLAAFETLERAQSGLVDDFEELADLGKEFSAAFAGPLVKEMIPSLRELAEEVMKNKETFIEMGLVGADAVRGIFSTVRELVEVMSVATYAASNFGETWGMVKQGRFSDALKNWGEDVQFAVDALGQGELDKLNADTARKWAEMEKGRLGGGGAPVPFTPPALASGGAGGGELAEARRAEAEEMKRTEGLRKRLAERQYREALELLAPQAKLAELKRRAGDMEWEAAQAGMEAESARLQRELEILDVKREQRAVQDELARAAEREADERARLEAGGAALRTEMDILRAEAAGRHDEAERLREEAAIQADKERFMREAGMDEADALRMARERAELERQIAANQEKERGGGRYDAEGRRADGRRQIKGYSFGDQGGADEARARAGLRVTDAHERIQADYGRAFLGLAGAPEFSGERLADTFTFPGLDAAGFGQPALPEVGSPLAARSQENAAAAEARPGGSDLAAKLDTLIQISRQGLLES